MGCGCKDKSVKGETNKDKSSILLKIINVIAVSLLMIILSPIIFIIVWVMGINSAIEGSYNPIIDIARRLSNRKQDNKEESEEINSDDYELLDVEVIK